MENKNVEEKNNLEHCSCDCGPECDCGDDCNCGPECDCGDDCGCVDDNCSDSCFCADDIKIESKTKKSSCCSQKCSGARIFGLIVLLLGIAYLGKNLQWWSFEMNWSIFWPVILIFFGSVMILKKGE